MAAAQSPPPLSLPPLPPPPLSPPPPSPPPLLPPPLPLSLHPSAAAHAAQNQSPSGMPSTGGVRQKVW
jgi:hypothetical protein